MENTCHGYTWTSTSENVPSDTCAKWRFRSACAFALSDQNLTGRILDSHRYKVSSCGQAVRLIWNFVGLTCHKVGFLMLRLTFIRFPIYCVYPRYWYRQSRANSEDQDQTPQNAASDQVYTICHCSSKFRRPEHIVKSAFWHFRTNMVWCNKGCPNT